MALPLRRSVSHCLPLGLVVWLIASSVCEHARGDELRVTLSYQAPPECPSAETLQSAIRRLVTAQTKPYSASVSIEREQGRFAARIVSGDGTERTLVGNTCAELAEATAVVLALAISPGSAPPEAPASPRPSELSAHAAKPAARETATAMSLVRLKLGAAGVLDLGTMPQLDWGLSARTGATARTWSAALEGAYWLRSQRETLGQDSNVGGNFSWWMLAAIGCIAARDGSPRVELCVGPELGHLSGKGFGLPTAQEAARFRLGFQAMAEIHWPLSAHLRLRAGLGAATVVLGRHAFYINGGELYRPQLFAGRAALGADVIF